MFVLFVKNIHAQNVGIGTTTPAARLDVKTPFVNVAQFNGGSGMFMGIFENDIYRGYWGSYAGADEDVDFGTGVGNVLGKLHLTIQASPKLTLDVNGNVGIGTITPSVANRLHVHDANAGQDASIGITNSLTTDGNLRGARLRMLNSDFHIMNYEATGAINLATNFNTRLIITANGNVGINNLIPAYALQVTAKNKYGIYTTATINGTDTIAGIYGLALSPTPVPYSAGVRGESNSTNFNGIGVLGVHSGSGWGVAGFVKELGILGYGAGVYGSAGSPLSGSGVGGYGVYGVNNNSGGTGGFFENNSSSITSFALHAKTNVITTAAAWLEGNGGSGIAVEIDGAIKVNTSATNKPFFTHVTAAINITGNSTSLTYPNPASTDFVIVTPNWTAGPVYNNHPIGVYFTAGKWAIFNQDLVAMPVGTAFNVMVIRQ